MAMRPVLIPMYITIGAMVGYAIAGLFGALVGPVVIVGLFHLITSAKTNNDDA